MTLAEEICGVLDCAEPRIWRVGHVDKSSIEVVDGPLLIATVEAAINRDATARLIARAPELLRAAMFELELQVNRIEQLEERLETLRTAVLNEHPCWEHGEELSWCFACQEEKQTHAVTAAVLAKLETTP